MSDIIENTDSTEPTEGASRNVVAYRAPSTYRELHQSGERPERSGVPLRTVVRELLLDGIGGVYADYVEPVLNGEIDHGSLAANEAIMGHRFIEADANGASRLTSARRPGGRVINALTIGRMIRVIVAEDLARNGASLEPRTMRIAGLLQRS